jgi:hypothetical protein
MQVSDTPKILKIAISEKKFQYLELDIISTLA